MNENLYTFPAKMISFYEETLPKIRNEVSKLETIKHASVASTRICYGCGTCAGICPKDAISMRIINRIESFVPVLNEEKCDNCGLCRKVCPWRSFNLEEIQQFVLSKQAPFYNLAIGHYRNCYVAYSLNSKLRRNASSGGVVPSLLLFMLKNKIIDGAILTRIRNINPLKTEAFIARSKNDILSATGSKYCPVAINTLLSKIKNANLKFAVVGLPCHIHGIRKAELQTDKLKNKIIFHMGLMCSGNVGFHGTRILLRSLNCPVEDVKTISYRDKKYSGWPGRFNVELSNGTSRSLPYPFYYSLVRTYLIPSCLMCWDFTNEFSDISFGDAWLSNIRTDYGGASLIITRSEKGSTVLEQAEREKYIAVKSLPYSDAVKAMKGDVFFKKSFINFRRNIFERLFGETQTISGIHEYEKCTVYNFFKTIILFGRSYFASSIPFFDKIIDMFIIETLKRKMKYGKNIDNGTWKPLE